MSFCLVMRHIFQIRATLLISCVSVQYKRQDLPSLKNSPYFLHESTATNIEPKMARCLFLDEVAWLMMFDTGFK